MRVPRLDEDIDKAAQGCRREFDRVGIALVVLGLIAFLRLSVFVRQVPILRWLVRKR